MKFCLCEGRHPLPEAMPSIFGNVVADPTDIIGLADVVKQKLDGVDSVDLYVTGLTVCEGEVVWYCAHHLIPLTLWHFDRASGTYYPQVLFSADDTWRVSMWSKGYT